MPPAPSEPEKYSIEEMLERLKETAAENPDPEGELVVRADGSQAMRVRRRKRRSEQPQREEAKRHKSARVFKVTLALVLLLLTGLGITGAYVYANTVPYRQFITRTIAQCTGAKVDFKLFRVSPASANAATIELEWPAGNVLKSLQLAGVSAKLSPLSLFGTSLRGEDVAASTGTLLLQAPSHNAPLLATVEPGRDIPVEFNRVFIPKFDAIIGDPDQPCLKLNSSEALLRMDQEHAETSLHLYHGSIQISGWPTFKIDRAVIQFHGAEAELVGLRLIDSQPKHGILELSGTLRPFVSDAPSTLKVTLENFDLGELIYPEFGALITAAIDTRQVAHSNTFAFVSGARSSINLDIAFKSSISSKVSIKGFPFLLSLVRTLDDRWYENPTFLEEASGVIHRTDASMEIRDLKLESKSRMAVNANLVCGTDKSLSGTMEIGIPESITEMSLNAKIDSMLTPARDGFRWLTLKIGGTLAHPSDNFAELYAAAKIPADEEPNPSNSATPPGSNPEKAFDQITRPKGP
ncbi:MAG: hypothetical protein WCO57_03175 [Verrucomicrobiota bacterium]